MGLTKKVFTLSAVAADETGETDWISPAPGESQIVAFEVADGGSWSGTLTFQCTVSETVVDSVLSLPADSSTASATQTAAGAIYLVDCSGGRKCRAKATTVGAGSVVIRVGVG